MEGSLQASAHLMSWTPSSTSAQHVTAAIMMEPRYSLPHPWSPPLLLATTLTVMVDVNLIEVGMEVATSIACLKTHYRLCYWVWRESIIWFVTCLTHTVPVPGKSFFEKVSIRALKGTFQSLYLSIACNAVNNDGFCLVQQCFHNQRDGADGTMCYVLCRGSTLSTAQCSRNLLKRSGKQQQRSLISKTRTQLLICLPLVSTPSANLQCCLWSGPGQTKTKLFEEVKGKKGTHQKMHAFCIELLADVQSLTAASVSTGWSDCLHSLTALQARSSQDARLSTKSRTSTRFGHCATF